MFKKIDYNKIATSGSSKVLLIYTGGTLGMVMQNTGESLEALDFVAILDHMPELHSIDCDISVIALQKPIDSSDMKPDYWSALGDMINRNYEDYDGFVVIHGTDTMVYTAAALSYMFEALEKPIILTGSQLPLGLPRSDAKNNLITSLELATMKKNGLPLIREVCIYFDYELFRGNRAKKLKATNLMPFTQRTTPYWRK